MSDFKGKLELIQWLANGNTIYHRGYFNRSRKMDKDGVLWFEETHEPQSLNDLAHFTHYTKSVSHQMIKVYRPKWVSHSDGCYHENAQWAVSKEVWEKLFYCHKHSDEWEEKEVPEEVFK